MNLTTVGSPPRFAGPDIYIYVERKAEGSRQRVGPIWSGHSAVVSFLIQETRNPNPISQPDRAANVSLVASARVESIFADRFRHGKQHDSWICWGVRFNLHEALRVCDDGGDSHCREHDHWSGHSHGGGHSAKVCGGDGARLDVVICWAPQSMRWRMTFGDGICMIVLYVRFCLFLALANFLFRLSIFRDT